MFFSQAEGRNYSRSGYRVVGMSRLGMAEPLGLCKAPTEPLGKNSSYSHNLFAKVQSFFELYTI
jgi:hypothetical protein